MKRTKPLSRKTIQLTELAFLLLGIGLVVAGFLVAYLWENIVKQLSW